MDDSLKFMLWAMIIAAVFVLALAWIITAEDRSAAAAGMVQVEYPQTMGKKWVKP